MIDYHVHPDFSPDAQGSIEQYCCRAIEAGLDEMCFTTHYEPDPARLNKERVVVNGVRCSVDSDWPTEYFRQIEEARGRFPGLIIRAGVEVGYEMGLEGIISDFLSRYSFDYALGAIHCLDHVSITSGDEVETFKRVYGSVPAAEVVGRYFDYIRAAAGSKLFDCLAHFDIYRKYIAPIVGPEFGVQASRFIGPALAAVAESGTGLEVNTSALRRGDDEPYPAFDIIRQAVQAGVRTFTIGSDAHRSNDIGRGIGTILSFLAESGITPARFHRRRPV